MQDIDEIQKIAEDCCSINTRCEYLVQYGILGLVDAVEFSNSAKGWKFSECLDWHVRQNMFEYMATQYLSLHPWLSKLKREIIGLNNQFAAKQGRDANIFEVANLFSGDGKRYFPQQLSRMMNLYKKQGTEKETVIERLDSHIKSLEYGESHMIRRKCYMKDSFAEIIRDTEIPKEIVQEIYDSGVKKLKEIVVSEEKKSDTIFHNYFRLFLYGED